MAYGIKTCSCQPLNDRKSGKDDPTISCSHLVLETSVLAGRKDVKWIATIPIRKTTVKGVLRP